MPQKLRYKVFSWAGYDLVKQKKQLTLESHLRVLLPALDIDVVLDVGANEGQYALMLRKLGYRGKIFSFEPLPEAYTQLAKRSTNDSNWFCFNYALGESEGTSHFNVARNSVFSSFHSPNERGETQYWPRIETLKQVSVEVMTLDALLPGLGSADSNSRILLKMDTQGHDAWVVKGATESMSRITALHSELSIAGIYEGVPDYVEQLTTYRDLGFELTGLFPSGHDDTTGHVVELDVVMSR